eukprot:797008_1
MSHSLWSLLQCYLSIVSVRSAFTVSSTALSGKLREYGVAIYNETITIINGRGDDGYEQGSFSKSLISPSDSWISNSFSLPLDTARVTIISAVQIDNLLYAFNEFSGQQMVIYDLLRHEYKSLATYESIPTYKAWRPCTVFNPQPQSNLCHRRLLWRELTIHTNISHPHGHME